MVKLPIVGSVVKKASTATCEEPSADLGGLGLIEESGPQELGANWAAVQRLELDTEVFPT